MGFPFPYFPLRIDKQANVLAPADSELRRFLSDAAEPITDLIVISHGWNNDTAEAERLYASFFDHAGKLLTDNRLPRLAASRIAVLGVLWPSKKFAEPSLIPGNAAGLGDEVDLTALSRQLADLDGGFDAATASTALARLRALLPSLSSSDSACEEFIGQVRSLFQPSGPEEDEEAHQSFFEDAPLKVFQRLANPVSFGESIDLPAGGSAAAGFGASDQGLSIPFSGIGSAASNVLNLITYYQMKERAGLIGSQALNPLLHRLSQDHPQLRLHLVGHSFGGRLVSATAAGVAAASVLPIASMSLLQAAFSHYGFAADWDGRQREGAFRRVLTQKAIRGPLIITHTAKDWAVGLAYPLASLLAGQNASGLGDERSDDGGIGRNGARKTPEAVDQRLLQVGEAYDLAPGRVHNLLALYDGRNLITGHGDVHNPHVVYAVLSAIAAAQP